MGLRGEEMEDPVELGRGRAAVGPLARRHMEGGGGKGGGHCGDEARDGGLAHAEHAGRHGESQMSTSG